MSIAVLVFPKLGWGEFSHINLYLTLEDLWQLGKTNKSAFVAFLREKSFRKSSTFKNLVKEKGGTWSVNFLPYLSVHEKVALVSYPRCGNTFLRKLLESSTGIVTGSDSRPNRILTASLLSYGFQGEGVTDNSVWILKSHFPERLGYVHALANRALVLIRNPFDAIESYFHMGMTNSHNRNLTIEAFNSLAKIWESFVRNEAKVWADYYQFWLDQAGKLPLLFIRYEDLLVDEEKQLLLIFSFLCEGKAPSRYYSSCKRKSPGFAIDNSKGYTPRQAAGNVGKGLQQMSKGQVQAILNAASSTMLHFGYKMEDNDSSLSVLSFDPVNFSKAVNRGCGTEGFLKLNDKSISIRKEYDIYGRRITELRHSLTCKDSKPFDVR